MVGSAAALARNYSLRIARQTTLSWPKTTPKSLPKTPAAAPLRLALAPGNHSQLPAGLAGFAARAEAQTDLSRSLGTLIHAIAEKYPTGTLEELQTALDERISSLGVPARKDDETDEEYRERVPWESYASTSAPSA